MGKEITNLRAYFIERNHKFAENITDYASPKYNETEVRVDFINPL